MTLRDYLDRNGLTLAQFGAAVGSSHAAVSRWASGACPPSWKAVQRIERATKGHVTRHDMRPDMYGPAPKKRAA